MLVDIVTDRYRACQPVATSLSYIEFSQGRLSGFQEIGLQPWQDTSIANAADRIRNDDIARIQSRLNFMGYQAGPVDGAAGPRTMDAFMAFKRNYCLPEDNRISEALVAYLTPQGPAFLTPPCPPEGIYAHAWIHSVCSIASARQAGEPPPKKWSAPIIRKVEDHRWPLRDLSPKRLS